MRQNKRDYCVTESRYLSNDAMVRRNGGNKWGECVSQPVLYAMKRRNTRDECVTNLVLLALMKRNKHVK